MYKPTVNRNRSVTHKHTTLFEYSSNYIADIEEFTDTIKKFYNTHDSVEVTIDKDGVDDEGLCVTVWWSEPETDEEMNTRIKREEERVKEYERQQEAVKNVEKQLREVQKVDDYANIERLMCKFSKKEIMEMMKRTRSFREEGVEK